MTIPVVMIFAGVVFIVSGWENVSAFAASRGDNTQPKPAIAGGPGAGSGTATPSSPPGNSTAATYGAPTNQSGYAQGSGAAIH